MILELVESYGTIQVKDLVHMLVKMRQVNTLTTFCLGIPCAWWYMHIPMHTIVSPATYATGSPVFASTCHHQCQVLIVPLVCLHISTHICRVTLFSGLWLLCPGPCHVPFLIPDGHFLFREIQDPTQRWKHFFVVASFFLFSQINTLSHPWGHLWFLSLSNAAHAVQSESPVGSAFAV